MQWQDQHTLSMSGVTASHLGASSCMQSMPSFKQASCLNNNLRQHHCWGCDWRKPTAYPLQLLDYWSRLKPCSMPYMHDLKAATFGVEFCSESKCNTTMPQMPLTHASFASGTQQYAAPGHPLCRSQPVTAACRAPACHSTCEHWQT
jgi:hypothetical protein